jgi:predicted DCC family thiol-disulfide oxidoreductase YuxK
VTAKNEAAFFCLYIFVYSEITVIKENTMDTNAYPLEFLYDGNCPICRYDVVRLHKADRHSRLIFIDVTDPDFDPEAYGQTRGALLARIYARRADGVMVEGPEVFRLALTAVGYGWLMAPTRWPVFNQITEAAYGWFARNRSKTARLFGGFFSRVTPECDLFCQQSDKASDRECPGDKHPSV